MKTFIAISKGIRYTGLKGTTKSRLNYCVGWTLTYLLNKR